MSAPADISLEQQIVEVELHAQGQRDLYQRAAAGRIKRTPQDVQRYEQRWRVAEAAAWTLKQIAERRSKRRSA